MNLHPKHVQAQQLQAITRRHFLAKGSTGIGAMALGAMLADNQSASAKKPENTEAPAPKFRIPGKAKHVIFLHMQARLRSRNCSITNRNSSNATCSLPRFLSERPRFPFIKGHPKMLGTPYKFKQCGESGIWMSELLAELPEGG